MELKRAERFRASVVHAIENGTFEYAVTFPNSKNIAKFVEKPTDQTVKEWMTFWLSKQEGKLKASTLDGYRKTSNQLISAFGDKLLKEIDEDIVYDWCETKESSNKTISNLLSTFRSCLTAAVKDKRIPVNPLTGFEFKRQEGPAKFLDPFSPAEEAAILNHCTGHCHNLFKFAFWSGMRTSEMVAMLWEDVNMNNMSIQVYRAKTQKATKVETTKTTSGDRVIKLLQPAFDALVKQRELSGDGEYVFINPHDGLPWKGDQPIRKAWTIILRKAGVRYRRPYQTRHTFASRMLTAGESLSWLSNHLGHHSVTMTEKKYAKYISGSHESAGNKALELFKNVE